MKLKIKLIVGITTLLPVLLQAQGNAPVDTGDANAEQTLIKLDPPEIVSSRLSWWREARFGMFIHWGLYSQWGCHYPGPDGILLNGRTEHMMRHLQIPRLEYAKIASIFNPVKFDADEWARIARDAGMKYMVITSKHHDGFAMFNSPSNDYNIVKQSPWARDPVRELANACRRYGLKFGVYYSLGRDWDDPDVPTNLMPDGSSRSNLWDFPNEEAKDFAKYFERKLKPQVRELLTQYGPIGILWFDTPEQITPEQSIELINLIHSIQPDCIVNQRVGNRYGDYRVAEQNIPAGALQDPWETCMTLNRHWGYYLGDEDWKPVETVVRNLIDIVSKDGNFLLNVGPTGEGVIPAPSVDRLKETGHWLSINGEAIYGASGSPIGRPDWGRVTQNTSKNELYLHVFEWPANGKLIVSGVDATKVASAKLMATGRTLNVSAENDNVTIVELPGSAPDKISSTIVLEMQRPQRAQWMQEAKWGVMTHYLADWQSREGGFRISVEKWNEMVNGFDVEGLADQLQKVGAKYHIFTIGQNSGYFLAPNPVYDRITGISPSKCSQRDLVADLSKALRKRGIRLIVYLPAGAPAGDREAIRALEWTNGPYPNVAFQRKWEQIIAWWSNHWGDAIDGWWFDGCFWPNHMYRGAEPNFESFARAARAGNDNNALAFCPGTMWRTISQSPHEDYISGELDNPERMSIRRVFDGLVDGAQFHYLSNIGERWGMGAPRFTSTQIIDWTRQVNKEKGTFTWDTPVQINGLISDEFMQQLMELGQALK